MGRKEDKALIKALYKYMLNNYRKSSKDKAVAQQVVEDVLDPNHEAEVDPDKIPSSKTSIMSKGDKDKIKGVHNAHFGASNRGSGTSEAGAWASPDGKNSKKTKQYMKDKHKEVLGQMKEMPKPNLPKAEENAKAKSVKLQRPRIKGVKRLKTYTQNRKKS